MQACTPICTHAHEHMCVAETESFSFTINQHEVRVPVLLCLCCARPWEGWWHTWPGQPRLSRWVRGSLHTVRFTLGPWAQWQGLQGPLQVELVVPGVRHIARSEHLRSLRRLRSAGVTFAL